MKFNFKKRLILLGTASLASLFVAAACGGNAASEATYEPADQATQDTTQANEPQDQLAAAQGELYTMSEVGAWGHIYVTLEMDGDQILDMHVMHNDTSMFVDPAIDSIIASVLEVQNPHNVDTVVGATPTTSSVLAAAREVFDIATTGVMPPNPDIFIPGTYVGLMRNDVGGIGEGVTSVSVTVDENDIIGLAINSHMQTGETVTSEQEEAFIASVLEVGFIGFPEGIEPFEDAPDAFSNLVDATYWAIRIAARPTQFVVAQADSTSGSGSFTPGVHAVTVDGRNAPITVALGTLNEVIYRVLVSHRDTMEFVDFAINQITEQVIATQSVDIDTVSGATTTSNIVIEALRQAYEQASN